MDNESTTHIHSSAAASSDTAVQRDLSLETQILDGMDSGAYVQFTSRPRSHTAIDKSTTTDDHSETIRAQNWSQHSEDEIDDGLHLPSLLEFDIDGVERRTVEGRVRWLYLTKPRTMTLSTTALQGSLEFQAVHGCVEKFKELENGYCFVSFSHRWTHYASVPQEWRRGFWEAIGKRFWCLTSSADEVRWDGRFSLYENLSQGWKRHLCTEAVCTECPSGLEVVVE